MNFSTNHPASKNPRFADKSEFLSRFLPLKKGLSGSASSQSEGRVLLIDFSFVLC
jgi:hypothetical protein